MRHRSVSRFCPQVFSLLALAAFLAGSCATAFSAGATVTWDAVPRIDVAGYKIYYQGASRSQVSSIDVGNVTSYKVNGLSPDTYSFCVTAYNLSGSESTCSGVVSISIPSPMYGDGGSSSEPKDAFQPGLYSRYVSENQGSIHSGREMFLGEWLSSRRLVRYKDRYQTEDMTTIFLAFFRTCPGSSPTALHQKPKLWRL